MEGLFALAAIAGLMAIHYRQQWMAEKRRHAAFRRSVMDKLTREEKPKRSVPDEAPVPFSSSRRMR